MRYQSCFVVALVVCGGCWSSGPFDYVPASGKIAYDDGSPIPGGCRLAFVVQDVAPVGNAYPRPGLANVDATGNFDCVTSHKYGDGLIPGKHRVVIQNVGEQAGKPVVPKEFTSEATTPLVVDTESMPFDIKVPKPKGR